MAERLYLKADILDGCLEMMRISQKQIIDKIDNVTQAGFGADGSDLKGDEESEFLGVDEDIEGEEKKKDPENEGIQRVEIASECSDGQATWMMRRRIDRGNVSISKKRFSLPGTSLALSFFT